MPYGPGMKRSYMPLPERTAYRSLEDVVGCKWSAGLVVALAEGVRRPGALERYVPGISKKILNERLRKLLGYGLIQRTEIPGRVKRVEYVLTPLGRRLARIIRQLRTLDEAAGAHPEGPHRVGFR